MAPTTWGREEVSLVQPGRAFQQALRNRTAPHGSPAASHMAHMLNPELISFRKAF